MEIKNLLFLMCCRDFDNDETDKVKEIILLIFAYTWLSG